MKIKNETLKKLTNKEANDLELISIGCMFVRGTAKQRVKGYKTTFKTETEIHYENEKIRVEIIALASVSEFDGMTMQDYCVRTFDLNTNEYRDFTPPMFALNFVK